MNNELKEVLKNEIKQELKQENKKKKIRIAIIIIVLFIIVICIGTITRKREEKIQEIEMQRIQREENLQKINNNLKFLKEYLPSYIENKIFSTHDMVEDMMSFLEEQQELVQEQYKEEYEQIKVLYNQYVRLKKENYTME